MKKLGLFLLTFLSLNAAIAQAPDLFKYQAIAHDITGAILANQSVSFEISILQNSVGGTTLYTETHAVTTNAYGLANLNIGGGAVVSGSFSSIGWGTALHFIQVKMDPAGGSAYVLMGTSQLLSVPYALHARTVQYNDDADANPANELNTAASLSGTTLNITDGGGTISVNLASLGGGPDADADPLNEIQTISMVGSIITLSNGGGAVTIPSGSGTDSQTLSLTGSNLTISGGNTVSLATINTDSQTLSISGSTLSIAGGNSVTLPSGGTDSQTLSIAGNNLTIAGGNTVAIPSSTTGQMSTSVYGTAQAIATVTTTTYTLIPGLTQTITVPANCRVIVSTDGGIQCPVGGVAFAAVDIGIHVDGVASSQGGQKEIVASNTDAVGGMVNYWAMTKTYNLSAGSHTIDVRFRDAGGNADGNVSGTDPLIQGVLTVTIINL